MAEKVGVLFDHRHERFAQLVASGKSAREAKKMISMPAGKAWTAKALIANQLIRSRIDELLESAAKKAALTRAAIIEGVQDEWKLARSAGQHAAALKAAEMLGSELHNMFRNKVEIGKVGEFDGKSEEELREFILSQMKELGMVEPAQNEPDLPQLTDQSHPTEH